MFYSIRDCNKNTSIFPDDKDIKKLKFNDDILNIIFCAKDEEKLDNNNSWTFSKLTRKSKPHLIYRDMLEKEFNKKIIDSKTDNNKNTSFYISERNRELYDYCMLNLKTIQ